MPELETTTDRAFPWVALITGLSAFVIFASEMLVIAFGIDYAISALFGLPFAATVVLGAILVLPGLWLTGKFGYAAFKVDLALSRAQSID